MVALEADRALHGNAVCVLEHDVGVVVVLVDKPGPALGHRGLGVSDVGDTAAALDAADVVPRCVERQDLDGALVLVVLVADPDHPVYGLDTLCSATGVVGHVDDLLQSTEEEGKEGVGSHLRLQSISLASRP